MFSALTNQLLCCWHCRSYAHLPRATRRGKFRTPKWNAVNVIGYSEGMSNERTCGNHWPDDHLTVAAVDISPRSTHKSGLAFSRSHIESSFAGDDIPSLDAICDDAHKLGSFWRLGIAIVPESSTVGSYRPVSKVRMRFFIPKMRTIPRFHQDCSCRSRYRLPTIGASIFCAGAPLQT